MKRISLTRTLSFTLTVIATLLMLSCLFNLSTQIEFNTTLIFLFLGISFCFADYHPDAQRLIFLSTGIVITLFAGLILSQSIFHYSLGIDQIFFVDTAHSDFPGRLNNLVSSAFILIGFGLILLASAKEKFLALALQTCLFFVILFGVSTFIGNLFDLKSLNVTDLHTGVSLGAAFCYLLVGTNLWLHWQETTYFKNNYQKNDNLRIIVLSLAILFTVAVTATLIGIAAAATNKHQFLYGTISIAITSAIGSILFYLLVHPFVKRLLLLKSKALTSKMRLRAIMDHVVEGIITLDVYGNIETANPKAAEMFGYQQSEIMGKKIKLLIPSFTEIINPALNSTLPVLNVLHFMKNHAFEVFGMKKSGNSFSAEMAISDLYLQQKHLYVCILRDISQRKAAEARLQESEAQFRSAFDTAPIGMALISLRGKVTQINSSLCQILGYTESELKQMNFASITHPDDLKISEEKQAEILNRKSKQIQFIKRFYHKNGKIIWTLLNASVICNTTGQPLQLIAQIQDITKQKEEEEKLNYKAHYDSLTGLVNRNFLELNLQQVIGNAQRNASKFALFFLDLDNFKTINDKLGHNAGDALLKIIAERLSHHTRKSDIVARLGGDEFILVLPELQDFQVAVHFAERIIKTISKSMTLQSQEISVSTSIGISFYPIDGTDSASLIKNADHALYRAKEKGRNNFQFCTNEISTQIQQTIEFENSMQQALDKNEFQLFYLPTMNADTRNIIGVEALLRWQSEQYGMISPQQIIPIAEETGFIVPLSEWIIKSACEQVQKIQKKYNPNLNLSVNISARQFMHNQLIDSVINGLNYTGFNPALFTLEINENLIMQDPKLTLDTITKLREKGVHVIIDNFGSGYSSLPFLQDFKVDAIKIDRTLIQQIGTSSERTNLIIAIIILAKNIGIRIIAEGVETKQQFDFLVRHGCSEVQGYYICTPVDPKGLWEFLKTKETANLEI